MTIAGITMTLFTVRMATVAVAMVIDGLRSTDVKVDQAIGGVTKVLNRV